MQRPHSHPGLAMGHFAYLAQRLRPHRRRLVFAMFAGLGMLLVDIGSPLVVAFLIDGVIGRGAYHLLPALMLGFLALPFASAVSRTVSEYVMTLLGQRFVLDIRLDLYHRVQRLSCAFLQNTTTGKLMERLRGDVQQLQTLLTQQTPTLVIQMVTGLIMIAVMFALNVRLTCLILLAIGLYVANYRWFVRRIRKVQRRYRRKMDVLSGMAQEQLTASLVVTAFGNERRAARQFVRRNFLAERLYHRFRLLNMGYSIASNAIGWSTYLMVTIFGAYFAVMGHMTYGAVTAMMAFTMRLLKPALKLAELSNHIQQAKVSLDRIFELMQETPDAIERTGIKLPALRGEVAFENVCFEYEPDKPVLRYFNLYVKPGQTVALVGHTGCGKSTIASLLYRFHEPQGGHLEIDGHDIWEYDTRWYRRHLALVPQDPVIFDTTLAHNIGYGQRHASRANIKAAARMAALDDLIETLPQGLDTPLGEHGVKLSVGEMQRLCIARAMLADPAILILDEATSSLDPQSEAKIQLATQRVMAQRTCFVIAHRLSTIMNADLIVVMDQGRAVEVGNHAQLMSKRQGRYRQMYVAQSAASRRALEVAG